MARMQARPQAGGRLCVNVAGVWRQPYFPLHSMIWRQLVKQVGLSMRGEIIWNKGASVGVSTAWGSWQSPSNPTLRDVHEYILVAGHDPEGREIVHQPFSVFSKDEFKLPNPSSQEPDISNFDFVDLTKSVWYMPTESANRVGHPAPFPEALPKRLIRLYTFPGDIVLDPFAGSGSTCVAAKAMGRRYIGYDIDKKYVEIARSRISQVPIQSELPGHDVMKKSPKKTPTGSRPKNIIRIPAVAVLGPEDVREREIRVDLQGGGISISIKTVAEPGKYPTNRSRT